MALTKVADSPAVACPPDKSLTHRALIFASLAKGRSVISNPLLGEDCISTMECFKSLGVSAVLTRPEGAVPYIVVDSPGWSGFVSPETPLNFGNSGTTARLLTGLFAATPGLFITAFGDKSLSSRPMGRVVEPLRSMGSLISGRSNGHQLPISILGTVLKPASHVVTKASAQVKSSLLLAGLKTEGTTTVTLPTGSRDHTEKLLSLLGANISIDHSKVGIETVSITGPFEVTPRDLLVPGDPSSAAFLAVFALLKLKNGLTITNVLENSTRTGFVTILNRMKARIRVESESLRPGLIESTSLATVLPRTGDAIELSSVDIEAALAPTYIDEVPILAVAAMFANGETRFRGLEELRVKESDRLELTAKLITSAGGFAKIDGDDLIVRGPVDKISSFKFDPDGDHRLAMSAGVLAKLASGPCEILGKDCVNVSFPGFFELIESIST